MGERKVSNHYIPLDFDPSKVPRRRQPKNRQMKVRTMLSMSIRCSTCGHFMYRGTKINSTREDIEGVTYLGFRSLRFYMNCANCRAVISFRTDPEGSDYAVECGATRNFEPWRSEDDGGQRVEEKRKIDDFAVLDELKSMKSRRAAVTVDAMLEALQPRKEEEENDDSVEALIESAFRGRKKPVVKRIDDEELKPTAKRRKADEGKSLSINDKVDDSVFKSSSVKFTVIKKPSAHPNANKLKMEETMDRDQSGNGLLQSLQQYGSDEED